MSTTEAPFVVSHNFCAVRANTVDELLDRLREFNANPEIADEISEFRNSVTTQAAAIAAVKEAMPGTVVTETVAAAPAAAAPAAAASPEMVNDKYGNAFTYNHPEAPALPDGRGLYVLKEWRDKNGKARKAFVDPVKGPKPFPAGAAEAPIVWV